MEPSFLPKWAWISLIILLILTAILASAGLLYMLDSDHPQEAISVDNLSNEPIKIEVAQLPTYTLSPTNTATLTLIPSPTLTITSTMVQVPPMETVPVEIVNTPVCQPPDGWKPYNVQQGDTLFAFQLGANRAGNPTTVDEIIAANCLGGSFLQVGQVVWLPEGAAENAPASEPVIPSPPPHVPRTASCPCTITILEGWRIEQIADAINQVPVGFSGADFLAVTGKGAALPSRDFLAGVPAGSGLEGFMLPGAYTLDNTTSAEQFRDMVLDTFGANAAGLINSAAVHGITPYQALIIASITQKESGSPNEQRLVASVFYNRIRNGKGIGATVTIMYALGRPGNWWPRLQSGQTNLDSPYNTLLYSGFPPTPISNPGLSALQATAMPAQTNYLYFTGNCSGTGNLYAETYEQHLANVNACQ